MLILVTGATGTIGSEVVKQLVAARQRVRALVRDRAKAKWPRTAVEVVVGDLGKPETLTAAFAGVERAFVLSTWPETERHEANAYEAAKRAGTRHIVKLSGGGMEDDLTINSPGVQWHARSEEQLRALGTAWTILRPAPFNSNMKAWGVKERGGLFLPSAKGKQAFIDPRDVAAVAVKALTTAGHDGKVYELTGPELLSGDEVVERISAATGTPTKFVDVPDDVARQGMVSAGIPVPVVDTFMNHFVAVRAGRQRVTSTVADVLGRPARTFDEWANDHVAELR